MEIFTLYVSQSDFSSNLIYSLPNSISMLHHLTTIQALKIYLNIFLHKSISWDLLVLCSQYLIISLENISSVSNKFGRAIF